MWDLRLANPFGQLSKRNILFFVTTMLVAIFGYIFASAPTAAAADATWNGSAITYESNQYTKLPNTTEGDGTGLPAGTQLYGYVDAQNTAYIISFPADTDITTAETATYREYDFDPPDNLSNPRNQQSITIDPQSSPTSQGVSSCSGEATAGIGWIICPVTNWLAGAMDGLFALLSGFLEVRPAQTSQDNALYRAWSYMRNFANVAFVIGFLIIIYSQLTSMGLSNYGIKKVLPRLIIAAILVNVSYWVCAIAIDISNILGYSLQSIFIGMRNGIVGGEGNSWEIYSWQSITGFALSGGTALGAAGIGGFALLAGTTASAVYMLLPILVGVLMAVLVALLIMAARQAIITVLVILAPLAFVAYLLPNTEKYFDKWRGLFMTMLLLFPLFSILFGGAQLAGAAIIQNANSINLVILGMAVQVAPVVVTPLLIRFSGSLLGRIAGMVNNPNRGAIDRTRKWASERGEQRRDAILGNPNARGLNKVAQKIDSGRRGRAEKQKASQARSEARWVRSQKYSDIQQYAMEAAQQKEAGESSVQARYEAAKLTNPGIQATDLQARTSKQALDVAKSGADVNWENLRAGHSNGVIIEEGVARDALIAQAHSNTERSQVLADNMRAAQTVQQHNYATQLERREALRVMAGGIDPNGPGNAEATAVSALERAKAETVKNIKEASPIKPGDAGGLRAQFENAIANNDTEAARAYVDLLGEAANPGFVELRASLIANESNMSNEMKTELKMHINSSGQINAGAEDIAQWSRDKANGDRNLNVITNDAGTWSGLSAASFAGMKRSSQLKALDVPGGVSAEIARTVLGGPAVQNLKPDVLAKLKEKAGEAASS